MIHDKLIFVTLGILWFMGGCVSLVRPNGEAWTQPVDLALTSSSLEGVIIDVRCLKAPPDDDTYTDHASKACRDISRSLRNLGASVYYDGDEDAAADQKKPASPDFSVAYVDRGVVADYCGWTLLPFIFSLGLFPCVQDFQTAAEVQILDENGLPIERRSLAINVVGIYGVPALYYLLVKNINFAGLHQRNKQLGINLLRYVQNVAATYNARRLLGDAGGGS